jgi:hypothetical protein
MDTGLTLIDLAAFTGKATTYYERYVTQSISQAEDLFEIATELTVLPESGLSLRLAQRGVLSMAEALYEGQASRDLRFSPFRSETIGSYSYSLASSVVAQGIPTGISWFDLAVSELRQTPLVTSSSVRAFDRPGDYATDIHGNTYLVGPADTEYFRGSPSIVGRGYHSSPNYVDGHDDSYAPDWPFS